MSRLGKTPVILPKGVEVKVVNRIVQVKGPKGTLSEPLKEGFAIRVEDEKLYVDIEEGKTPSSAFQGLMRALVRNMVEGVSKGFEKRLSLVGVGYRAAIQGSVLDLQLGFSHPTKMAIPKAVQVSVDKNTLIVISGSDKRIVGQFAASVRAMRPPEPYKGKGIRYEAERVRKKAGKAAKGKTG
ncbi:MAG: 50S ribosomal protein L6 [Chlamydiae bacterium]|nr:50S ribosomal protein L6 [Chlamydiota bacterium]